MCGNSTKQGTAKIPIREGFNDYSIQCGLFRRFQQTFVRQIITLIPMSKITNIQKCVNETLYINAMNQSIEKSILLKILNL